jgi:hypothetical protein
MSPEISWFSIVWPRRLGDENKETPSTTSAFDWCVARSDPLELDKAETLAAVHEVSQPLLLHGALAIATSKS